MAKRLLLIGGNFSPEQTGIGKYNGEMVRWLAAGGYDCSVITSYPYYPQWKVQEPYVKRRYWYKKEVIKEDNWQGKITVYRCPQYVPAKPSGKTRMLLDFSFAVAATLKLLTLLPGKKFDVVISVVPPFHLGLLSVLYKKIRGAKVLYHVQDMQIEAARDLNMIRSPKLIRLLFRLESYIMKHADMVSSISDGMMNKIQQKAGKEIFFFPNWVDVNLFHPLKEKASLKTEYGFSTNDRIVLYSGAIGEKQGLEAILHAAGRLKEFKFLICGSGPYKERLQQLALNMQLTNVIFFPLQPFERFNHFLNMADLHLVIQKGNASDLVMPSKLTTILAVGGLALVTANNGTSLHRLVSTHNMGIVVEAEDQEALNEGIIRSMHDSAAEMARNGRAYAENYLAVGKIMTRFEEAVIVS